MMLTTAVLGAGAGVVAALIVIAAALAIFKYRKLKRLNDAKERHGRKILLNPAVERRRKPAVVHMYDGKPPSVNTPLCGGVIRVVEQPGQLPIRETAMDQRISALEADLQPVPYQMRRPSSLSNLCIPKPTDSITSPTNSTSRKFKISKTYKSTSSLFHAVNRQSSGGSTSSSKSRKSRSQRPSLYLATPKYFDSGQEAIASPPANECSTSENEVAPEIALSMLYNERTASLTVTILCIKHLDRRLSDHQNIYVQATLRPQYHQKQVTRVVSSFHPEFNECFYFDQVRSCDLATSHLLVTVNKSLSNKRIAELFITLASIKIEYGKVQHFKFNLMMELRSKKKSTLEKLLEFELGQMMILVRYQPIPNRLKVVVHKAVQLPRVDSLPFKPVFQVNIELYHRTSHQPIESKSTAVQSGDNPTWNEVFLFNLTSNRMDDHYVDFTVVEKRRYNLSDAIIGHVLLGPDSTSNQAIIQWNDCSSPLKLEEGKWHSILPSIKFNMDS